MMAFLHPFRSLRDSFQQIGTAVNASGEYSRAGAARADASHSVNPTTAAIPL
jgi:hypothetical protein